MIDVEHILKFLPEGRPVKITYVIKRFNIEDMENARFLQVQLRALVDDGKLEWEIYEGTRYYTKLPKRKEQAIMINGDLQAYQGVELFHDEQDALIKLEKQIGQAIPVEEKVDHKTFGFVVNDNNVIGLGLYHKSMKSLPGEIGKLKSLRYLCLGENQLKSLPASMINLRSLIMLDISRNYIPSFHKNIKKWIDDLKEYGCKIYMDV